MSFLAKTWAMYRDGFRAMTVGRSLWLIIAVKLAVMFLIIRMFLMPDTLSQAASDDESRAQVVRSSLILHDDSSQPSTN